MIKNKILFGILLSASFAQAAPVSDVFTCHSKNIHIAVHQKANDSFHYIAWETKRLA